MLGVFLFCVKKPPVKGGLSVRRSERSSEAGNRFFLRIENPEDGDQLGHREDVFDLRRKTAQSEISSSVGNAGESGGELAETHRVHRCHMREVEHDLEASFLDHLLDGLANRMIPRTDGELARECQDDRPSCYKPACNPCNHGSTPFAGCTKCGLIRRD